MSSMKTHLALCAAAMAMASQAQATAYNGTFGGTTPTGWQDTAGVFGAPNTVYSGVDFSGSFAFDVADYVSSGGLYPQFDASGDPTPGYAVSVTLNGVTVQQPDASSYFGPFLLGGGAFGFYIGGWNGFFYLEAGTDVATTQGLGITQSNVDNAVFPAMSFSGATLSFGEVTIDHGGGRLPTLPLGYFTLAPVPEPSTWMTMAAGLALAGCLARRQRRQTARG